MPYIKIDAYPSTMLNNEDWGTCQLFLDIGVDGYPVRQMEFHGNGMKLRYSKTEGKSQDEYSVLCDGSFQDSEDHRYCGHRYSHIDEFDFEILWNTISFDNSCD